MPLVEARSSDCRSNVENAPRRWLVTGKPATPTSHIQSAILRMPPSPASSARRPRPDSHSHYVVISRDGLGGSLYHAPKLHAGPCSSVGVQLWEYSRGQTDR